MSNPSKVKGTGYETLVRNYLVDVTGDDRIIRPAMSGSKDVGDIANLRFGDHKIAVECKDHRKMELGTWIREAETERDNLGALIGIVVHKRPRKTAGQDQFVTMTLGDFMKIWELSQGRGSVPR